MFWFIKRKAGQSGYVVKNIRFGAYENSGFFRAPADDVKVRTRAGYDRIRHSCWRACCDRYHRDNALQTKAPRIMECHSRRDKWSLSTRAGKCGQSTVEFAIITAGLLALVIALGTLWHALDQGLLVEHALSAASHHLIDVPAAFIADIFRY